MRVAVSGASGLIGSELCRALEARGDHVVRLVRRSPRAGEVAWDPGSGALEGHDLSGVDAAVHLSGAGIGDRRWTPARRASLVSSRIDSTALLAVTLAGVDPRPRVLVNASAVGIYGDRGSEELTEASPLGTGFLAELCRRWEAATAPAAAAGIRTVCLRSGIVLSRSGGALARQLPLFRLGLGGRLGSGRQWVSWISITDEVNAVLHAVDGDTLSGPVNAVAPNPVTNTEFTSVLAGTVHRPAVLAVPAPVLRLALGRELVDEVLLASQRAQPAALHDSGFVFSHPRLDSALADVVGG
ncbi:MAG TPA: TIGR01777 family protein [Acidimicrobiaceae bacterium]|nr:TIGR01777 family protein [Acidimicrobiaceae bacterium]